MWLFATENVVQVRGVGGCCRVQMLVREGGVKGGRGRRCGEGVGEKQARPAGAAPIGAVLFTAGVGMVTAMLVQLLSESSANVARGLGADPPITSQFNHARQI